MAERLGVVGIGNALVDVLAEVGDPFLAEQKVTKGAMTLIDAPRAGSLYGAMPPARELSGGSGANTIAGVAVLGVEAGYIGKVSDDQLGQIFTHDLRALGVRFGGPLGDPAESETGRCLVLITPDGERSMNTFLGVSVTLTPEDVDATLAGSADWLYLEGYLFDTDEAKAAYAKAIGRCRDGGGRVAFTVSDSFCVERHRADMRRLVSNHVDLLFANRDELLALYETTDLEQALQMVSGDVDMAAVTLSADGAIVATGSDRVAVPATAIKVLDTTGAGDLFAAGFLAGQVTGRSAEQCAHMGCIAAGEVIGHIGARPEADLKALVAAAGL
ncbi:MAG: adenosine kinase [Pseudomonadota bacterium]